MPGGMYNWDDTAGWKSTWDWGRSGKKVKLRDLNANEMAGYNPNAVSSSSNTSSSSSGSGGGGNSGGSGGSEAVDSQLAKAAVAADPWATQRGQYMTQLNSLMQGGESAVASDPSFQFRQKQGQQALERSQAAQGFLGSGNMAQSLVDYGQNAASQEYNNQYNRLAALAGVNSSSPSAAGSILAQAPGLGIQQQNANTQQQSLAQQASASASGNSLEAQRLALAAQNQDYNQAMGKQQFGQSQDQFAWNKQAQVTDQMLRGLNQGVEMDIDY